MSPENHERDFHGNRHTGDEEIRTRSFVVHQSQISWMKFCIEILSIQNTETSAKNHVSDENGKVVEF